MLFEVFYESIKTILSFWQQLYLLWRCYSGTTTADVLYYKYTDSQRPPVSTPTGYVNQPWVSTVTVTDPAPTTNKLTTPKAILLLELFTNVAPRYSDTVRYCSILSSSS